MFCEVTLSVWWSLWDPWEFSLYRFFSFLLIKQLYLSISNMNVLLCWHWSIGRLFHFRNFFECFIKNESLVFPELEYFHVSFLIYIGIINMYYIFLFHLVTFHSIKGTWLSLYNMTLMNWHTMEIDEAVFLTNQWLL